MPVVTVKERVYGVYGSHPQGGNRDIATLTLKDGFRIVHDDEVAKWSADAERFKFWFTHPDAPTLVAALLTGTEATPDTLTLDGWRKLIDRLMAEVKTKGKS